MDMREDRACDYVCDGGEGIRYQVCGMRVSASVRACIVIWWHGQMFPRSLCECASQSAWTLRSEGEGAGEVEWGKKSGRNGRTVGLLLGDGPVSIRVPLGQRGVHRLVVNLRHRHA